LLKLGAGAVAAGLGLPVLAQTRILRIGATVDNTGAEKASGTGVVAGSRACFAAINKAGGIDGLKIEMQVADDRFQPEVAKANAQAFAADPSVLAMLHPVGTRQVAEVCAAVPDMPVIGPYTGTVSVRKKSGPNTFWVRASFDQEIARLISQAVSLGQTRIGLVYSNDPLGLALLAGFNSALAKAQLEPAVVASTPSTSSTEVESSASKIAQAKPQVVIVGLGGAAPAFISALRAAGGRSAIYGLSITAGSISDMGESSLGLGFSIVVPSPFSTRFEIVRKYQAAMLASGQKEFSLPSLEGYIDATVLIEGLRRLGPNPTRAKLMAALESIEDYDLGGLKVNFGRNNREGSQFVDVAVIGSGGRLLT
jgi:ABC-type branched-subunit amino acid transport system substrate-binding protein